MLRTTDASAPPLAIDIRAATMDDIYPILHLHREAFSDKFGAAFGMRRMARGIEAMAEAWRRQGISALRGMLVATAEEQVVGTICLRTWEMGNDGSDGAELAFHQTLGLWGAIRSIFTLSLLDHQISRAEGYITDVAVLNPYRRQGIAQALLSSVESEARRRRKQYMSLYVSATNQAARNLYLGAGFRENRIRRSLIAGYILHQQVWIYMRKECD